MVKRKTRETLTETKRRLRREQEERTEARIKQLQSPVKQDESETEEDWTEIVARIRPYVRQEEKEKRGKLTDIKVVQSAWCASRLCRVCLCLVFAVFVVILFMFVLSAVLHVGIKRSA
jgi:hypothetical protein